MEALTTSNITLFLAFVVPGFLSMRVYGLLQPVEDLSLKDSILEAIAFGIVNFALMSWAIALLMDPEIVAVSSLLTYALIVLIFVLAPTIWPIILYFILNLLARKNLILQRHKTSWDDFFSRKERCWVIVHLKDGRRLGGWYGENSYSTLYPRSGHIYIEELWRLDEDCRFLEKVPASRGAVLRPDDYHFLELFDERGNIDPQQQDVNERED